MGLVRGLAATLATLPLLWGVYETFRESDFVVRESFEMGNRQMAVLSEERVCFPKFYVQSFVNGASVTNGMHLAVGSNLFKGKFHKTFSGVDKNGRHIYVWPSGYNVEGSEK